VDKKQILTGKLTIGSTLPRESDFVHHFGVSLITIRHALRVLETEGFVLKQAAKATVVTRPPSQNTSVLNLSSLDTIVTSSKGRELKILSYTKTKNVAAQNVFGLQPDDKVFCLESILYSESKPLSYSLIYFAPEVGKQLSLKDFDDVVVFRSVEKRLGVELKTASVSVTAEQADQLIAEKLEYQLGDPLLAVSLIYYDSSGEPLEFTINRNRGDIFNFQFDITNGK